jgi:hypothetical protein
VLVTLREKVFLKDGMGRGKYYARVVDEQPIVQIIGGSTNIHHLFQLSSKFIVALSVWEVNIGTAAETAQVATVRTHVVQDLIGGYPFVSPKRGPVVNVGCVVNHKSPVGRWAAGI